MKPTKSQIAEVTRIANENNVDVEAALSHLNNCSLSIYKVIGAKGVVEAAKQTAIINAAEANGGIALERCTIAGNSEKALYLVIPMGLKTVEKWIAKSIIKEGVVPFWAVK